jgi:hypothetical protein
LGTLRQSIIFRAMTVSLWLSQDSSQLRSLLLAPAIWHSCPRRTSRWPPPAHRRQFQASWPAGSGVMSPGPAVNSAPSSIWIASCPLTWSWKYGATQPAVPVIGLTSRIPAPPPRLEDQQLLARARRPSPGSLAAVLACRLAGHRLAYSANPCQSITTHGSSPMVHASCPGAMIAKSPGP